MPTTYAHWRFGQDCIDTMPKELKEIVNNNLDIYNLGVHGPDIFFYDLLHGDVAKYGNVIHHEPSRKFFEKTKDVMEEHEEKDAMLAYCLGFLSHFTLDSLCHGYVERKKEVSEISHGKIESEWDGHVMMLDERMVNMVDRAESLRPNKEIAKVISYFFDYDEKVVLRTTKMHHMFIHLLNYVTPLKFDIFTWLLTQFKKYDYRDLFIAPIESEKCMDSNIRLDKLRNKARKLYPKLLKNYMDYLHNDKPLPAYFNHDFEPWIDYQEIPVLSVEEELDYVVK